MSRFTRFLRPSGTFIRYGPCCATRQCTSSAADSRSCSATKSRMTTRTSMPSIFRRHIRRARASIRSLSPTRCCSGHTPRRCKFAQCKTTSRRLRSLRRDVAIGGTRSTHPPVSVQSDRGTPGRRGHSLRPSERDVHRHVPRAFRRGCARAFPSLILLIHRTERRF